MTHGMTVHVSPTIIYNSLTGRWLGVMNPGLGNPYNDTTTMTRPCAVKAYQITKMFA